MASSRQQRFRSLVGLESQTLVCCAFLAFSPRFLGRSARGYCPEAGPRSIIGHGFQQREKVPETRQTRLLGHTDDMRAIQDNIGETTARTPTSDFPFLCDLFFIILLPEHPSLIFLHLFGRVQRSRHDGLLIGKPLLPNPRDQELHIKHAYMGFVDQAKIQRSNRRSMLLSVLPPLYHQRHSTLLSNITVEPQTKPA